MSRMPKTNRERVLVIVEALGELCSNVVFVGGSVSQFYADDSAVSEPRPTEDVDCIVDLSTYSSYMRFCMEELARRRIVSDSRPGSPMCRFVVGDNDNMVDIMPIEDTGIGESNRWYKPGFAVRKAYEITTGKVIYLLPVLYYIATKLEALRSRGGNDYRGSKDFEDIVYVLASCSNVKESCVLCVDRNLMRYLADEFTLMLQRKNIDEEIECSIYSGDEDRGRFVKDTMKYISNFCR